MRRNCPVHGAVVVVSAPAGLKGYCVRGLVVFYALNQTIIHFPDFGVEAELRHGD